MKTATMSVLAAAMAAAMAIPTGSAQTPAAIRKIEQTCGQLVVRAVRVPGELKIIEHTKRHDKNAKDQKNFYTVCYQTRTQQGGFAFVVAACDYADDGTMTAPIRVVDGSTALKADINVSNMFCTGGS